MRLKNLETMIHLAPDGGDGGGTGGDDGGDPLITSGGDGGGEVTYTFAKAKTKNEKGEEVEVDAPEDDVKFVTEFAKVNKLTPEQAQAFMNHHQSVKTQAPAAPPETYTFAKVKTKNEKGEEVESDVSATVSDPIAAFAKEHKLSQEVAQALLDRELKMSEEALDYMNKAEAEQKKEWREHARKDPVLSKGNFEQNMGVARRALKQFFPGIDQNASEHPFLDHPDVLRGLYEIGQKISSDGSVVIGENQVGDDGLKALYPTMKG